MDLCWILPDMVGFQVLFQHCSKIKNIVISFFSFSDIIRILNIYLLIVLFEIFFPLKFSINIVQKMENIKFGVVFESDG